MGLTVKSAEPASCTFGSQEAPVADGRDATAGERCFSQRATLLKQRAATLTLPPGPWSVFLPPTSSSHFPHAGKLGSSGHIEDFKLFILLKLVFQLSVLRIQRIEAMSAPCTPTSVQHLSVFFTFSLSLKLLAQKVAGLPAPLPTFLALVSKDKYILPPNHFTMVTPQPLLLFPLGCLFNPYSSFHCLRGLL